MTDTSLYEWPQRLFMIFLCMGGAVLLGIEVGQRKPPRVRFNNWVLLAVTPLYVFVAMMGAEVPLGGAFRWVAAACSLPAIALVVERLSRKPVGKDSLNRVQSAVLVLYMVGVFVLLALSLD